MRILWVSNDPCMKTGYGTQTAQVTRRLARAGHDVAILANAGSSTPYEWEGIHVFPQGYDVYSNDVIDAAARAWNADQIIVLFDAWPLEPIQFSRFPTAVWCPVDHANVPPKVLHFFKESGALPIAMSQHGQAAFAIHGYDAPFIPHAVDTEVFKPYDQAESRGLLDLDADRFVVGMVSTNKSTAPSRKGFPEAFRTFGAFAQVVPEALLYVHANMFGNRLSLDLNVLAVHYGIHPDNLLFADQLAYRWGIADDRMARLYSAFDVLSFVSLGEGFGIPAIEAQACGTPVISSNFTAQKELNPTGWQVGGQPYWDEYLKSDFQIPNDRQMVDALWAAYTLRDPERAADKQFLSDACREFAVGYDADKIFGEFWVPTIGRLEKMLPATDPISL